MLLQKKKRQLGEEVFMRKSTGSN